jgi:hypothetical protein
MPTVLRVDGFRFFFYSSDRSEPVHVHVEKGKAVAKVWVEPVPLERSRGFSSHEINTIVVQWNEFFND